MYLERLSITKKIIVTGLSLICIAFLDFISGNEISFSIFYLLPITIACWYINRNTGLLISLLSAALWLFNDFQNNAVYSNYLIPYWNALVRLGFFLSITFLLDSIKNEREKEKDIMQFIVHDLRSPLSSILTSFKLLIEDNEEPLSKNQSELIELSTATGNRMLIFINSLLDLERLKKKKMPLHISKIDVPSVINTAKEQVKLLSKEKNIIINVNNQVEKINADDNLLLRILVNLLSNAIKVSNKNSQIEITVEKFDEKNIIFKVKDEGPGIPKGMENKLFGKFNQGSSAASGSGIGLTFCKLAAEAHGGYIKLESIEGAGTTVFFVLPENEYMQ